MGDPAVFQEFWAFYRPYSKSSVPHFHPPLYHHCKNTIVELDKEIRDLHRRVKNVDESLLDHGELVLGTCAQHMLIASIYAAYKMGNEKTVDLYTKPPYYAAYPAYLSFVKGFGTRSNYSELVNKVAAGEEDQIDWEHVRISRICGF